MPTVASTATSIANKNKRDIKFLFKLSLESLEVFLLTEESIKTISFEALIQLLKHYDRRARDLTMYVLSKNFSKNLSGEFLNSLLENGYSNVQAWTNGRFVLRSRRLKKTYV